jgi:hypothetical protein
VQVVDAGSVPLAGVTSISAGNNHSLALTSSSVFAWGQNQYGRLGDGATTNRMTYVQVVDADGDPLTGVSSIAAGGAQSFAVTPSGVLAWGDNYTSALGDGANATQLSPALGANFQPASVSFAGTAGTSLSNSGTTWSITTPAGVEGSASILATANIFGGTIAASPSSVSWNAGTFTYVTPAPIPDPIVTFPAVNFAAGGTTTVTATGFPANTLIRVELRSTPVTLGTFTTNSLGGFTTNVIIPRSTPAGNHHIVFVNAETEEDLSSTAITVASVAADPETAPAVNSLSATGVNAHEPLLQGVLLLFLGLGVMVVSRRLVRGRR